MPEACHASMFVAMSRLGERPCNISTCARYIQAKVSKVEFSVSIPDDFDLEFPPDVSFETPSPDTIFSLYRLVLSQAVDSEEGLRELEELRAENERKDIELNQALQDRKSSVSSLETPFKGLQEELVKVKQECNTLGESHVFFFNA